MDFSFENRFNDLAMDIFFKMARDLSPVSGLLTEEMWRIFQADLDRLLRVKQVNRLENIAARKIGCGRRLDRIISPLPSMQTCLIIQPMS